MRHVHPHSLTKMQRDDAANIRCIGRLTCLSGSQVELAPFMFRQTKELETYKLTLLLPRHIPTLPIADFHRKSSLYFLGQIPDTLLFELRQLTSEAFVGLAGRGVGIEMIRHDFVQQV